MGDGDLRDLQLEVDRLNGKLVELEERCATPLRKRLATLGSSQRLRIALVAAVLGLAAVSYAAQISVPYTFVNGTIADADEMNANFDTLVVESNAQDLRIAALEGQVATNMADIGKNSFNISTLQSDVATNTSDIATNAGGIGVNAAAISANASDIATNASDIATNASDIATNQTDIASNAANIATNTADIDGLETTFTGVSRNGDLLTFSGMNVRVVDGSGNTYGAVNGLGNLIIGYNEDNFGGATRTGSHNFVVGMNHSYTNYGGLVAGSRNTISGAESSVTGGYRNTASSSYASVSGGAENTASDTYSSINGGRYKTTSAAYTSVLGANFSLYNATATSTTPVETYTMVHEYCVLERMSLQTGDAGTYKYCSIAWNAGDTWTLTARGGSSSANVECRAICF